jgi:hypothetical protein
MGMSVSDWSNLIDSLFDCGEGGLSFLLPGSDLGEWLCLIQHDYDEVDRLYLDYETIGG